MPDAVPARQAHSLTDPDRRDWLRLIRTSNVGPGTFFRLLDRFGTAARALDALPDLARRGGRGGFRAASVAEADREIAEIRRLGAQLIARGEAAYPPLLAHIPDPPPLIIAKGRLDLLGKKAIGVVGARNASANGRRFAEKLAADLGAGGLMVVSGLARGIDAAAHRGALATGTAAVLGGGIDVVYPEENRALYDAIADQGVLLTEVAPGTQPQARHFPRRNRIISGMARGVVVVEASPNSGSLITARLALDQGREVFAVPGAAMDPRARGTNGLIKQGAVLTECADDVLEVLAQQRSADARISVPDDALPPAELSDAEDLEKARSEVVEALGPAPLAVDHLVRACHLSPSVVLTVLLELELAGRLERHPGGTVSLLIDP